MRSFSLRGELELNLLCAGSRPELLPAREQAFREAGFHVQSATTCDEAIAVIRGGHHDVLVVGMAADEEERNRIAAAFKSKNPGGTVVFLYHGSIRNAEMANAVLSVVNPPADLARAIRVQMGRGIDKA